MFWQSIIGGLIVLGNMKVLIGLGVYMSIAALMAFFAARPTFSQRTIFGLVECVVNSIALGFVIAWLLPTLFGFRGTHSLEWLFQQSWSIVGYSVIGAAGFLLLAFLLPVFIPLIGRIISLFPAGVFIPGLIVLHLVFSSFYKVPSSSLSPGILATIAYIVIACVIERVLQFPLLVLFVGADPPPDLDITSPKLKVIGSLVTSVGGILALFMYASYMGLFLQK
jgi:hypothetical protein